MSEKLVRDNTPADIQRRFGLVSYRLPAGEEEFLQFLFAKLGEEYYKYIEAGDLDELARMFEVVRSLCAYFGSNSMISASPYHAVSAACPLRKV